MPNIELRPYEHASSFRRIAAAAWDDMYQATIYGQLKVRTEPLERWIEAAREKTGRKITITHCVARALAILLANHPDMNAIVMHRTLYLRKDIDVYLQVALPSDDPERVGKTDLAGVCVRQADKLSVTGIADYVTGYRGAVAKGGDRELEARKKQTNTFPGFLINWGLKFLAWLQYRWNIDTGPLGVGRDPFGSAMVTSVGMFDAPVGFAPFFPLARCPIILCIGSIVEEPVVENGHVVPGRVVYLQATMDHRIIDGYHAGTLSKELKRILTNPEMLGDP